MSIHRPQPWYGSSPSVTDAIRARPANCRKRGLQTPQMPGAAAGLIGGQVGGRLRGVLGDVGRDRFRVQLGPHGFPDPLGR